MTWQRLTRDGFLESLSPKARQGFLAAEERMRQREEAGLPRLAPSPNPCPADTGGCNGAGVVYARPWFAGEESPPELVPCPRCATGAQIVGRMVRAAIGDSGLSQVQHVNFETLPPKPGQESYWDWGKGFAANPAGTAWLCGGYYLGKSTLAMCIANALHARSLPVMFRVLPTMFDELKGTFDHDNEQSFHDQWAAIKRVPYLVLDDFGREQRTAWSASLLFELCEERVQTGRCTVFTSNLDLDQLGKANQYPRIAHRIRDQALIVPFTNDPVITGKGKTVKL